MQSSDFKEINEYDVEISKLVEEIKQRRNSCHFMETMADDPFNFIQKWIASQARDLKFAGLFYILSILYNIYHLYSVKHPFYHFNNMFI